MTRFASLTAGLLARKGEAEPASTPFADQLLTRVVSPEPDIQGLTPMLPAPTKGAVAKTAEPQDPASGAFGKRILYEVTSPRQEVVRIAEPPPPPPLLHEEDEHHEGVCGPVAGSGLEDPAKTFHVNLRLKRARFVKLKLSAALLRRPVQDVVSEALDNWFEKLPPDVLGDCACMKSNAS